MSNPLEEQIAIDVRAFRHTLEIAKKIVGINAEMIDDLEIIGKHYTIFGNMFEQAFGKYAPPGPNNG